jgi:hypothetical protein
MTITGDVGWEPCEVRWKACMTITGDMGWEPCEVRWKACMVRLWNRLLDMPIARNVFQWNPSIGGAWATEMPDLFQQSDCEQLYENQIKGDLFILKKHGWCNMERNGWRRLDINPN